MNPVTACNLALNEIGNRTTISSINPSDGSTAANVASLFYVPKTQALLRAAHWDFCRKTLVLTQLKAVIVNGQISSNPPQQPFLYEYAWPPDCLKARFIMPTVPLQPAGVPLTTGDMAATPNFNLTTRVPFVVGTDADQNGNPIKVILTNLPNAQLVYTADYSQACDLWDPLFLSAETATLGAYFINALARNKEEMSQQIGIAKTALDTARAQNASEGLPTANINVDWLQARYQGGGCGWAQTAMGPNGTYIVGGWDSMEFPGGLRY